MYRLLSTVLLAAFTSLVIVIVGGMVTAFAINDASNLSFEGLNCKEYEVKTGMDAPLDNLVDLLGGKLAITEQQGPNFVLTLYTVFAIPVGSANYGCSKA